MRRGWGSSCEKLTTKDTKGTKRSAMKIFQKSFLMLFLVSAGWGQAIKVTLLGTGTPRPMIERFGASILVQAGKENLLFDAGRGCTIRLWQLGVPLKDVRKLFLTHLHSDQTEGNPDLSLTV